MLNDGTIPDAVFHELLPRFGLSEAERAAIEKHLNLPTPKEDEDE